MGVTVNITNYFIFVLHKKISEMLGSSCVASHVLVEVFILRGGAPERSIMGHHNILHVCSILVFLSSFGPKLVEIFLVRLMTFVCVWVGERLPACFEWSSSIFLYTVSNTTSQTQDDKILPQLNGSHMNICVDICGNHRPRFKILSKH